MATVEVWAFAKRANFRKRSLRYPHGKRDAQLVAQALYAMVDVREAIENSQPDAALDALDEVHEVLLSVKHTPGVNVAAASEQLGVSEPTIRSWVKRGALSAVPKVSPMQIEPESLHRVSRALAELRKRGQDRDRAGRRRLPARS